MSVEGTIVSDPAGGEVGGSGSFWRRYVFSVDHKVIGKQYLGLSLLMALLGGFTAYLVRWQLAWPETPVPLMGWVPEPIMYEGVIPPNTYNALFTMHGTIMIFFVAMPFVLGAFGNYLIPLMVGAEDMAFPRLNMMSFWTLAVASSLLIASFFVRMDQPPVDGPRTRHFPRAQSTPESVGARTFGSARW